MSSSSRLLALLAAARSASSRWVAEQSALQRASTSCIFSPAPLASRSLSSGVGSMASAGTARAVVALAVAGSALRGGMVRARAVSSGIGRPFINQQAAARYHRVGRAAGSPARRGFASGAGAGASSAGAASRELAVCLFQYEICPFCHKVKALLDLFDVPYYTVEVNPLTKAETKSWSPDYRKVPIAMLGEEQVNDSPVIVQRLLEMMVGRGVVEEETVQRFASESALQWAEWSDKQFSVLLFPNICKTRQDSLNAFRYVYDVPTFSKLQQIANHYIGGFAMSLAQGKIKKKYNIDDETAALNSKVAEWLAELGDRDFHGGDSPDLADVAVFGAIRSISHTQTHADLMQNQALLPWYKRMMAQTTPSARVSRHRPDWLKLPEQEPKPRDP